MREERQPPRSQHRSLTRSKIRTSHRRKPERNHSEEKRSRLSSESSADFTPESSQEGGSKHGVHSWKLRRIEKQLAEIANQHQDGDAPGYDTRPPFTKRILRETIPRHFKIPQVEPYDGTTDPLDHLGSFKAHMMIQGASDALYCLAFPATLKKAA